MIRRHSAPRKAEYRGPRLGSGTATRDTVHAISTTGRPSHGWHRDPWGEGLRWFDGNAWTQHTAPDPTSTNTAPAAAAEPVQQQTSSPAWHPDPWGKGLRWFDGATWTEHTTPESMLISTPLSGTSSKKSSAVAWTALAVTVGIVIVGLVALARSRKDDDATASRPDTTGRSEQPDHSGDIAAAASAAVEHLQQVSLTIDPGTSGSEIEIAACPFATQAQPILDQLNGQIDASVGMTTEASPDGPDLYCNGSGGLGNFKIVVRVEGEDPTPEYRSKLAKDGVVPLEIPTAYGPVLVPDFATVTGERTANYSYRCLWYLNGVSITVRTDDNQDGIDGVAGATGASALAILQAVVAMPLDPR